MSSSTQNVIEPEMGELVAGALFAADEVEQKIAFGTFSR
jgi:hypothetical protein